LAQVKVFLDGTAEVAFRYPRQSGVGLVNDFCSNHLNPYVNFHRPCFFSETITDAKGKEQRRDGYEEMKTLYEKLKSIPYASRYLKPASPLNN
jgi:hypothetical protein